MSEKDAKARLDDVFEQLFGGGLGKKIDAAAAQEQAGNTATAKWLRMLAAMPKPKE